MKTWFGIGDSGRRISPSGSRPAASRPGLEQGRTNGPFGYHEKCTHGGQQVARASPVSRRRVLEVCHQVGGADGMSVRNQRIPLLDGLAIELTDHRPIDRHLVQITCHRHDDRPRRNRRDTVYCVSVSRQSRPLLVRGRPPARPSSDEHAVRLETRDCDSLVRPAYTGRGRVTFDASLTGNYTSGSAALTATLDAGDRREPTGSAGIVIPLGAPRCMTPTVLET